MHFSRKLRKYFFIIFIYFLLFVIIVGQTMYGMYVPPPVDVWCAEKAKLKTYKLNDNVREYIEFLFTLLLDFVPFVCKIVSLNLNS